MFGGTQQLHDSVLHNFKRGEVNLHGLPEWFKCGKPGAEHAHHFTWPYDFEEWRGVKDAFVWEVKPPYQPEPMPGFAAYFFCRWQAGDNTFLGLFSDQDL
jgi:hypothetical protein